VSKGIRADRRANHVSVHRRDFLKGVGGFTLATLGGVGGILSACNPARSAVRTAQPLALQLNWIRNVEFAGNWSAMEHGYYQEEGVDLSIIDWAPTIEPIQNVASGTAQIGFVSNGLTIASARANGIPVKAFGAGFQKSPGGLVTLKEQNITTPADLVGKVVGIQQTGRLTWDAFAAVNNLQKVETFVVGFDATPLVAGQVDAYMGYVTNQPYALAQQGIETNFMYYADYGFPRYDLVAFATDKVLANNKELIVGWFRATIRGWQYVFEHPDEVAKLVVEKYGKDLDLEQQKAELQTQIALMQSAATQEHSLFWMGQDVWQAGVDRLKSIGELPDSLSVDEFVTMEILEAVG